MIVEVLKAAKYIITVLEVPVVDMSGMVGDPSATVIRAACPTMTPLGHGSESLLGILSAQVSAVYSRLTDSRPRRAVTYKL